MGEIWPYIAALIPSAGIALLFYIVIKNMIEGDRKERLAQAQWDAQKEQKGATDKDESESDTKLG